MKKPLLLASMAGSALFLVGALVIIVGFIHQAAQKPNTAADATAQAQHYCQSDKHYTGDIYSACYNSYTDVASLNSLPSNDLLGSFASLCSNESHSDDIACSDGLNAGYSNLKSRLQPATPAPKTSSSSSAAKPSTSSSSSKSSSSKSSSSSSSKSSPAPKAAATTTSPAPAPVVATTSTPTPPAVQPDTPGPLNANDCQNSGGANVSGVWDGIPGVSSIIKNGCIGGNGVNPIYQFVSIIITFATGVLGLVMVLMIVIAGLQYVISNGSPDIVRDAKNRINHVVTGFVIFVLMWGILQVLLPPNVSIFK